MAETRSGEYGRTIARPSSGGSTTARTVRIPVNDLGRSWIATSSEVLEAVEAVLASGWYIHGPQHAAFEQELAEYVGVTHAIGVANGTDALVLALLGAGCEPGSEVVCVANAGGYASVAAARVGCPVVYADVDAVTLQMTPATLDAVIGARTTAVVLTHLYGDVGDVESIAELCRSHGIALIEDCAQALGARVGDRRVGTFGTAAAISFYPTKNLGAAGDGGAVVTSDEGVAERVRSLRQYGWAGKYAIARAHGTNSRLDELQAAILRIGLRHVDDLTEQRRAVVRRYADALASTTATMVSGQTASHVAHLAVLRSGDRDRFRAALEAGGIGSDIHYPVPDHRQPGLPAPARETDLRVTELAANEVLTIPCFPEMTSSEIDAVCDVLRSAAA